MLSSDRTLGVLRVALREEAEGQVRRCDQVCWFEGTGAEELEKHLILNSHRFRTFKDARLWIVTYVEAKFGWRIRDSKPSDPGSRGLRSHGC